MNAKKTICMLSAGAMLVAAAPVFADPPHWARGHGYRDRGHGDRVIVVGRHYRPIVREYVVERPVYVERRVYVERPVYYSAPPAYYAPAPVYAAPPAYGAPRGNVLSTLGGAIVGAAVGNQIGGGSGRTAATAVGAVVGGMFGSGY
jgi:hypothetical protein